LAAENEIAAFTTMTEEERRDFLRIVDVRMSQIAHSDMHHPVSEINALIHSVSLASHVSTHLFIHLSAHLCHHHHSHHPSLLHSFTPDSKPTSSTNPFHFNTSGLLLRSRDWTGLIMILHLVLVRFFFNYSLFVPCG